MKKYFALLGIFLMTFVSGCFYELRDEISECKISWQNKFAAKSAWRDTRGACMGIDCPHSFKEGFMAGYIAVTDGGTGCPPAIPMIDCHNHMWLDRCSESQKMEAWYDGYEHGAMAARETGMADVNRMTTRTPQATPIDYSMRGESHLNSSPHYLDSDSAIPPSPVADPEVIGGPQTNR